MRADQATRSCLSRSMAMMNIGTAGWTVPRDVADQFPAEGTSLARYSARFNAAEINSSFHRPHRLSTWERWRDSVPDAFRFSVKLPKTITHQAKLVDCGNELIGFLEQAHILGDKLAVLLVQLPPKLEYDAHVARDFFADLRSRSPSRVACEPRNASWFTAEADEALARLEVTRVAADPALSDDAARPGGWPGLAYWRLHGSPVMYRSSYADRIAEFARSIAESQAGERWCIFDNTASSAATADALALAAAL
jgi:uncharacterized protein YecE (DUF72 family)